MSISYNGVGGGPERLSLDECGAALLRLKTLNLWKRGRADEALRWNRYPATAQGRGKEGREEKKGRENPSERSREEKRERGREGGTEEWLMEMSDRLSE